MRSERVLLILKGVWVTGRRLLHRKSRSEVSCPVCSRDNHDHPLVSPSATTTPWRVGHATQLDHGKQAGNSWIYGPNLCLLYHRMLFNLMGMLLQLHSHLFHKEKPTFAVPAGSSPCPVLVPWPTTQW